MCASCQGAFWSLLLLFILGLVKLILDFVYPPSTCNQESSAPWVARGLHYMYYALFSFWLCVIINVVVSLLTSPQEEGKVTQYYTDTTATTNIATTDNGGIDFYHQYCCLLQS